MNPGDHHLPRRNLPLPDGETFDAGPGDIGVVTAGSPHKFKNIGTDRLEIVCIHASPGMIQEWVVEK
jgi:mannose-6-phosphate isomerase-like protein (cupin superfamily)